MKSSYQNMWTIMQLLISHQYLTCIQLICCQKNSTKKNNFHFEQQTFKNVFNFYNKNE